MFLSEPPASDVVAAKYGQDRESDGYVSNATRLWCWRPDVLEAFYAMRALLIRESELSPGDAALLFAATAAARSDSYCSLAWGTELAAQAGAETAAQVLAGSAAGLDPRSTALSDWARRVATDPNSTTPADVGRLHEIGMTDRQIFEATMLIAWRMAFSTVNDALGAQPDAQLAAAAPAPVRAAVSYGRPPSGAPSL
jgi:uncharacterized peroxidase-related enzyme